MELLLFLFLKINVEFKGVNFSLHFIKIIMTKKIFSLLILFSFVGLLFSQNGIGIKERQYINSLKNNEIVSILVKGEVVAIKEASKVFQATIKYNYDNIFAIAIKKEFVEAFTKSLSNSSIEIPISKGSKMMDTALVVNSVDKVHVGLSPLVQSYTGTNVVVGILDSGIYFDHPDFKKADGTTRIRFIWDQNVSSGGSSVAPLPYNYGAEWSWLDIDNGSCNHVEPANQYGHGTTVAGVASGNGFATGKFKGVAPESEIIAVAVDYYGSDFLSKIVDAVDYVFKKADAMGKPSVINISLGTYFGSHDGKDLPSQMIDALIEERSGRAVVASAGNGNNIGDKSSSYISTHLSYEVNSDTSFTWFNVIPSEGKVYFDLWADTTDFKNVSFAFQNDNPTNFSEYGRTDFLSIANDFNVNLLNGVGHTEFVFNENNLSFGKVEYYIEETEGRYHLEFLISPDTASHIWRFMTTGSGKFDVWSSTTFQGTSNMIKDNLPPSFVVADIVNYKTPDNRKTIVSSFQCSDKVITVGNYSLRHHYYDVDSTYHATGETPGEIAYKSSEGPTRDERLKPDISATGDITFSTGNLDFINLALAVNRQKVSYDTMHQRNGGTSIASPVVAGAVALYLEKNPDAHWYEVKEALIQTAKKDAFTGSVANTVYGNGKLDAFNLLQFDAVVGCTDATAFNYDATANVDDGSCEGIVMGCTDANAFNYNELANTDDNSCIPKVFGCTDTLALNYDATANTADGTCEYTTSINDTYIELNTINFSPNPLTEKSYLEYNYPDDVATVNVFNLIGKKVFKGKVDIQNAIIFEKKDFIKGIYFIEIKSLKNNVSKSIKFVVN